MTAGLWLLAAPSVAATGDHELTVRAIEIANRPTADGKRRIGVDYVISEAQHRFCMWEGHDQHSMSTTCTAAEVLADWQPHLAAAGALWLMPWLTRIAAGEVVERADILAASSHAATPR